MAAITFFKEDLIIDLRKLQHYKKWVLAISENYNREIEALNYIFCSDAFLLNMNKEYLNHDTFTDIITFDLREHESSLPIEADVFISVERVKDNAKSLGLSFEQELGRVIIHGLLHLIGFTDKTKEEKDVMRAEETKALLQL